MPVALPEEALPDFVAGEDRPQLWLCPLYPLQICVLKLLKSDIAAHASFDFTNKCVECGQSARYSLTKSKFQVVRRHRPRLAGGHTVTCCENGSPLAGHGHDSEARRALRPRRHRQEP